jgi:16S rRNA processing protein RimM
VETRAAYVTVARVLRAHGRRGEVAAEILTDFPQRLTKLASAELYNPKTHTVPNGGRSTRVLSCWLSHSRGGQAIFHFEGSDSIDDAKRLVGLEVQIPLAERPRLPGGSYYVSDLTGCEVVDQHSGTLGRVADVEFIGEGVAGTPNLVVDSPRGEILIPLAEDICVDINVAGKRITVSLPEGLRDLNVNS